MLVEAQPIADPLSYQDAVATEATWGRAAPQSPSGRHARLMDYLHERRVQRQDLAARPVSADVVRVDPPIRPFPSARNLATSYPAGQPTVELPTIRESTSRPTMLFEAHGVRAVSLGADRQRVCDFTVGVINAVALPGIDLSYSRQPSSAAKAGYDPRVRKSWVRKRVILGYRSYQTSCRAAGRSG